MSAHPLRGLRLARQVCWMMRLSVALASDPPAVRVAARRFLAAVRRRGAHGAYVCSALLRPPRMGPFPRLGETGPLSWRVRIVSRVDWLSLFISAAPGLSGQRRGRYPDHPEPPRSAGVSKRSEFTWPGSRSLPREPSQANVGFRPRHLRPDWPSPPQGICGKQAPGSQGYSGDVPNSL
jgi:hypothetical protein